MRFYQDAGSTLTSSAIQLETEVDALVHESLQLLKAKLAEVQSNTTDPTDFSDDAGQIVSKCVELKERKVMLESEIDESGFE